MEAFHNCRYFTYSQPDPASSIYINKKADTYEENKSEKKRVKKRDKKKIESEEENENTDVIQKKKKDKKKKESGEENENADVKEKKEDKKNKESGEEDENIDVKEKKKKKKVEELPLDQIGDPYLLDFVGPSGFVQQLSSKINRQKVIIHGKVYWIRVKELDAWFPNFQEDDQDDLSSDGESQEGDVANKVDNNESDADRVSESSFMHENDIAHKDLNERRDLWDYLCTFIDRWEGDTVIMGDFNEVRSKHERFGSTFNRQGAIAFNNFISSACLIDLPLEGLKINLHKSKLMGIGVSSNIVAAVASLIGCSILTAPFNYLGVKNLFVRISFMELMVQIGSLLRLAGIWIPRGGVEQENYGLLCSKVADPVLSNVLDRWCWSLEGSQEFLVKSSHILIDNTILPKAKVPTRWLRVVPIKVNVHAWRVCLDKLPTRANLSLRGMDIPSISCPLCNSAVESSSHIFFACLFASQVWRKNLIWWELEDVAFNSYNEWLNWIVNIRLHKRLKVFLEGICYVIWWLIWRFRNQLLFGSSQPRCALLFDDVV
nr:RNA-directed DNA polymerase, eukaryota [Tanacetum cinerariifolium]